MNKITNIVIALVCLLMVSANAQAEVQKRIWTKSTNAENLPKFQEILKAKQFDVTATDILAKHWGDAAWEVARNGHYLDLVDPKHRSKDAYSKKFLDFAFFNQPGDVVPKRITWYFIQRKGQGNIGWRLPVKKSETVEVMKRLQTVENKILILQEKQVQMELGNLSIQTDITDLQRKVKESKGKLDAAIQTQRGLITENSVDIKAQDKLIKTLISTTTAAKAQFNKTVKRVGTLERTNTDQTVLITNNGERISRVATVLYVLAFLAIVFGGYLIWLGKKQDTKTKAHEVALHGDGSDENSGLVERVAQLEEAVHHPETGLAVTQQDITKAHNEVAELKEDMEAVKEISLADVVWDKKNASAEELSLLSGGRKKGVVWAFRWNGKVYTVLLWRDAITKEGLVCTDIIRDKDSDTLANPIAIRHLKFKIVAAVKSKRLTPNPRKKQAA
ncbi:MAG: hypothetical protein ACI9BF_000497 [Candidatus Paceibacteria bacterium]